MFPFGGFLKRSAERLNQFAIAHDVQGLLKGFEFVGTHQDERGPAVAGHQDAIVLTLDPVGQLREMRLDLGERERVSHDREYRS